MRLAVEVDDYDEAVRFYRDVLSLREEAAIAGAAALMSRSRRLAGPPWRSPTRLRSG